jgi:hypothetical protein
MKSPCAVALVSAIILVLGGIPASAASYRTWVSGTGSDAGSCPITAPCASFQYALSKTNANGEINCLTAGDFGGANGSVVIDQSVSIVCDGISNGGILNGGQGAIAITINGGNGGVVYLSGLDLEGMGTGGNGVQVNSGSTIYIVQCTIRGFDFGINVESITNPTRVVVKDSIVVNNSSGGVFVQSNGTNAAILVNTTIDGNQNNAVQATTASSIVALERTLLTGSPTGLNLTNGASAELIGPSNAIGGAITGTTTSVPFK